MPLIDLWMMRKHRASVYLIGAAGLLGNFNAWAAPVPEAVVIVSDAWVRETVPGQRVGAAYMRIRSRERVDLVGAESDIAEAAEVHRMSMTDGLMKMRELNAVRIEPGRDIVFQPGGTHIMLVDLRQPLRVGADVKLKLHFRRADDRNFAINVTAGVRPMSARGGYGH